MSHTPMTAPAQTSSYPTKEKNDNLQLVPQGMHPAIIYGVVNVGTQDGEYQGRATASNKLKLVIEFPGHKQLYWKGDTVPSPSAMIMDFNYSVSKNKKSGKKSKLLLLIESLYGPLQESQYLNFDISQLAGLKIFANVVHYYKLNGDLGAKIDSISQFNPAYVNPDSIVLTNEILIYSVQMGFENMSFAKLPFFYRSMIKESHEGKKHIAAGGRFTRMDETGTNMIIDDGSNNYATAPSKIVMIGAYSYEQLKSAGWDDQAMIDNGYARRETVQAPAPVPIPQTPAPLPSVAQMQVQHAQLPQAPMSIQPQMPQAHTNPSQPMLTMIDKSASYEDFIRNGWTDTLLIQHGKAIMMPAQNDVFPPQQVAAPPVIQGPPPVQQGIPQAQQVPNVAFAPPAQHQAVPQGIPAPQPTAAAMFNQATVAPVQQMGTPIPQGIPQIPQQGIPQAIPPAPISNFETPTALGADVPPDDLPF